jgi:hypothetical protein
MPGKISMFLKAIKDGIVTDVPPEYQACEICREVTCDSAKAEKCTLRAMAENEEIERRSQSCGERITPKLYDVDEKNLVRNK